MSFNQNANVPTQNGGATIAQIPPPSATAARGGGRNDQTMLTSLPPPVPSSQQQQQQQQQQYSTMMNQGNLVYSQQQPFANPQFQNQSFANQPYYDPYQQQRQHQVMQSNPNSYAWSSSTGGGQQQQYAGNYHQRHHYQYGNPPPSYPQQPVMTYNYPQQMAPGRASMNSYSMSMPTRKKVTLKLVILGNSG
jgi:hypothetical protein